MSNPQHAAEARERYRQNVIRAEIADLLSSITGQDIDLVSYDEVAKRVRARQQIAMGTQMVPLERIVGSVGRYRDFTRTFLPRTGINQERWVRIDAAMNSLEGLPPIELYKIGEVYFVRDGNHRVSVARANGLTHIEAYVTEVQTDIPLTVDDFERDQWLIKVERSEFLAKTDLDEIRPGNEVYFTEPGRYSILLQHIEVHQYLRGKDLKEQSVADEFTWQRAVASWYDAVYLPVIQMIRKYKLMEEFPNRTEADLYLWIAFQRERLAAHYNLAPLSAETAVATFAELHSDRPIEKAYKGLRAGVLHLLGADNRPLGMSEEEFQQLRARHDAGERSLAEAENERLLVAG
jgi:hypothetical protein